MREVSLSRWIRLGLLVTLVALVAAACSDVEDGGSSGGGATGPTAGTQVPDNRDITIRIAVSPWDGSAANANVAKVLLEDKLGYTVELVEIDEYAQFPALANGDLDATLEVWPSGHGKDYKKYIESGNGVVDGGELGVIGQIGWWIPTYLLEDHPELATWEGLKGNEDLFRTPESGDAGQILDGDPSYVTFDQAIADNLGLNLKVVYAGSEAAELAALDAAYQKREPILFYFWTPHWAHAQYDLTMIELPEVTPECEDAAVNNPDAYACGYPQDVLYKAFHEGLEEKAPAAFAFLSAMRYTNEDQNAIALEIHNGTDPEEAARGWIDANPDVWQPWVDAGLAAS
ncbi:Glycine betaine/carnitine transport binding protein GbuC [bacterium HR12]|nr:Glycine betaine/carnitine transport binding protein GbuC [bacterium HR12]